MDKEAISKKTVERMFENLEEDKPMDKEVEKEVVRVIKEARENKEEVEIIRDLKLQYSKQFFVRFPTDFEKLMGLKEGKKIRFIIKVNPKGSTEKTDIRLKVIDDE